MITTTNILDVNPNYVEPGSSPVTLSPMLIRSFTGLTGHTRFVLPSRNTQSRAGLDYDRLYNFITRDDSSTNKSSPPSLPPPSPLETFANFINNPMIADDEIDQLMARMDRYAKLKLDGENTESFSILSTKTIDALQREIRTHPNDVEGAVELTPDQVLDLTVPLSNATIIDFQYDENDADLHDPDFLNEVALLDQLEDEDKDENEDEYEYEYENENENEDEDLS